MIKLKHKISLAIVALSLGILVFTSVVYAPWQTLGTGYAITTNYHGVDVLPGTPVTATAGTLDPSVVNITFRWHFPNESVAREVHVFPLLTSPYPPDDAPEITGYENSTTVWYAQDILAPDVVGDWGVQAFFRDSEGTDKANLTNVIKIRAESFNAVPEIPLGTIGAAATMIIALALFALKKKKAVRIPRKF